MSAKRGWLVVLAATALVYFFHLGSFPLLGPDEPRYAQVAREMLDRGDWVTPTLGGQPWFEKPALLYWLMTAFYALFGVSEFTARAGSALCGLSSIALVGWAAARAEHESGMRLRGLGLACAVVTASCAGLVVFSHAATFDIVLTATVTAALACFYASEVERDEAGRRLMLAGFYAAVGASLLAKGLAGLVIPAGVVVFYHLLRRRFPNPLRLGAWWGVLLTAAVAALWYAPVMLRHGREFFDAFILQHHFARYLSNKYAHPQPFWFYAPITLMLALPWTVFFARGLWAARGVNWHADDAETKLRALAVAWVLVPVAFFSLSGSKLPGYVLPGLPGALLLAGWVVLKYLRGEGELWTMRLTGVLALLLFAAGAVYAATQFGWAPGGAGAAPVAMLSLGCVAAAVAPSGVAAVVALFSARRRWLAFVTIAGATLLTVVLVAACALEGAARAETLAPLLAEAEREGHGRLRVLHMMTPERSSQFYAAGRVDYDEGGDLRLLIGSNEMAAAVAAAGGEALVIVPPEYDYKVPDAEGVEWRRLGDNGASVLFHVRTAGARRDEP
ncbi:MAG TPA: glycosyltransferase family 39 protein [Pyrinomonadaceae bacterium]|nr:glycosyltransferase family 39 protein [Pyrinomonadaceae bacterium]